MPCNRRLNLVTGLLFWLVSLSAQPLLVVDGPWCVSLGVGISGLAGTAACSAGVATIIGCC